MYCQNGNNQLCSTMCSISLDTSEKIISAKNYGLSFQEETITENALLLLKNKFPRITIEAFSRHKEAKNGADWEWYIGTGKLWFHMRVQAKKKRTDNDHFKELQTYQSKSQPQPQIDVLISQASKFGMKSAYCLYVGGPVGGCFIASAAKVKARNSNLWKDISKLSSPWNQIVCNCNGNSKTHTNPPDLNHKWFKGEFGEDLELRPLPEHLQGDLNRETLRGVAAKRKVKGFLVLDIS